MQHSLTFKHVTVKPYLSVLVNELLGHLDEQTASFPDDSVFTHVVIEQNKARTLFKVALLCALPKRSLAVHEEGHDAVATVREAFDELERQLGRYKAKRRRTHLRKKDARRKDQAAEAAETT
jgi:ribosome-associated translation inhibitor RaiA